MRSQQTGASSPLLPPGLSPLSCQLLTDPTREQLGREGNFLHYNDHTNKDKYLMGNEYLQEVFTLIPLNLHNNLISYCH